MNTNVSSKCIITCTCINHSMSIFGGSYIYQESPQDHFQRVFQVILSQFSSNWVALHKTTKLVWGFRCPNSYLPKEDCLNPTPPPRYWYMMYMLYIYVIYIILCIHRCMYFSAAFSMIQAMVCKKTQVYCKWDTGKKKAILKMIIHDGKILWVLR